MENAVLFLMILLLSLTEFMIVFLLKRKVKKTVEEVGMFSIFLTVIF